MAKKESFFWTSYSDLMTSMFFVMLVLFVLVVALLHKKMSDIDAERKTKQAELIITQARLAVIEEIVNSTKNIDSTYFEYRPEHKKHVLKIHVQFRTGSADINDIDEETLMDLIKAGNSMKRFIEDITHKHPTIQYLLVIEGQASKDSYSRNYELSYERALSLKKLWESEGINFGNKCEVVIGGNGDGSLYGTGFMREPIERDNQRFLIHILPKTSIPEK